MPASKTHASSGLNHGYGNLGEDLSDDVHARDAANLGLWLHVDSVRDDLEGDALDVVGDDVVPVSYTHLTLPTKA